jgi:hypothetical protein
MGSATSAPSRVRVLPADSPPVITLDLPAAVALPAASPSSLRFRVEALGVTYQWTRNGVPVEGATGDSLPFPGAPPGVAEGEAAVYACLATNAFGAAASTPASVVFLVPVVVTVPPLGRAADVGATVALTVQATGSLVQFQWRRDGVALGPPSAPAPGPTASSTFEFTAGEEDQATSPLSFTVHAFNDLNSVVTAVAAVVVGPHAPYLLPGGSGGGGGVRSRAAVAGQVVVLEVAAAGTPPLAFQWRSTNTGRLVPGATGPSFQYTVTAADVATKAVRGFACTVSNAVGVLTAPTQLVAAQAPPVIVSGPGAAVGVVGRAVTLRVTARGTALQYQWLRNGEPVPWRPSAPLTDLASPLLTYVVTAADPAEPNATQLSVRVFNAVGSVTSSPAALQVCLPCPPG